MEVFGSLEWQKTMLVTPKMAYASVWGSHTKFFMTFGTWLLRTGCFSWKLLVWFQFGQQLSFSFGSSATAAYQGRCPGRWGDTLQKTNEAECWGSLHNNPELQHCPCCTLWPIAKAMWILLLSHTLQVRPFRKQNVQTYQMYVDRWESFPASRYHSWPHAVSGSFAKWVRPSILKWVR